MTTITQDWRARAACRDVDPEQFFPAAEAGPVYDAQVAAAKAVCARCPVRPECLDEALARMPYGIAGGLTPEERRATRRGALRPRDTAAGRAVAVVETGLRRGARPKEVRAAGRVLLAAGRPVREVAARCGVSERTAARWATTSPSTSTTPALGGAGKGRGGSRALPLISHNTALTGTRATEGPRG